MKLAVVVLLFHSVNAHTCTERTNELFFPSACASRIGVDRKRMNSERAPALVMGGRVGGRRSEACNSRLSINQRSVGLSVAPSGMRRQRGTDAAAELWSKKPHVLAATADSWP